MTHPFDPGPDDMEDSQYGGEIREAKPEAKANGGTHQAGAGMGEWDAGDDVAPIKPRGWLLGNVFCRQFISSLLGDGGCGKTALRIAQCLALASGRPITGEHVFERCRVLFISLEDDADELRRRVLAARQHHGISQDELRGWLFLAAPGAGAGRLMAMDEKGQAKMGDMAQALADCIARRKPDLIVFDPFVKAHAMPENDNSAMDLVVQSLADLATAHRIALDIPHHTRKGLGGAGNADSGRGASAVKNAARLVYSLQRMTPAEAQTFGVEEKDRCHLIRMDSAKVNLAPMDEAKWFRLVGVPIGNASDLYPRGDEVQTVEPWTPPDAWAGLSGDLLTRILDDIEAGLPDGNRYTDANRAGDRGAWHAVTKNAPDKSEAEAKLIIKTWTRNGVLVAEPYENPATRKTVKGLHVIKAKRPA